MLFTGVVQGIAKLESVEGSDELRTLIIEFPDDFCRDLTRGASVSVNGVCLTATDEIAADKWALDVMLKSLTVTNLRAVEKGHLVNVERAAKEGAEIGGHPLSGHVDFMAEVIEVQASAGNKLIRFEIPETAIPYVFSQGYIAVDGASLTIADLSKAEGWFEVWLIPETRRSTILDNLAAGDHANIEIDRGTQVVVDTIKNTIEEALEKRFPRLEAALLKLGLSTNDLVDDFDTPKLIQEISTQERSRK
ncbi:riboflavin synthase subunit alpha [uncultured Roseibium sp.]|uniref:riboflavin synthase subunit alpha n=1 Tax=uncultured Roseibium sp. TaxID=1936171 RepID=UPI003216C61E